jgi:probable biosynthetic protein (TIGR04098 family)
MTTATSINSRLSVELGMPLLGRRNLSENALLKMIGNHRWAQIQELGGVPTSLIRDDAGSRLYATFYFIELKLCPERPLGAYGENDVLSFTSDLSHYEKVYLDGCHHLDSEGSFTVRSSNVFIYQERGPSKLSLAMPENMDFSRITGLASQPDSLSLCRQAKTQGTFVEPEPDDIPLFEGWRECIYEIDPDRDLNGAGLIYFANFVCFMDFAERRILGSLAVPFPADLLDARSTYLRRIGYYGNAQASDSLSIRMKARMRILESNGDGKILDMGFDYRITRLSDQKEIAISSSRKSAPLQPDSGAEIWLRTVQNQISS